MKKLLSSTLAFGMVSLIGVSQEAAVSTLPIGFRSEKLVNLIEVPPLHIEVVEALEEDGLRLEPGQEYVWRKPLSGNGNDFQIEIEVDESVYDSAILTIWNWHNEPIAQESIASFGPRSVLIPIVGCGSYLLTLDGFQEGEFRRRLLRNLTVTESLESTRDVWRSDQFFLGICAFPGRYHWKPDGRPTLPPGLTEEQARVREADLLAAAGFQVVRTDESLEMGKQEEGAQEKYRFDSTRMDAAVDAYTSRGFSLALQTMSAADWAIAEEYESVREHRWRYPHREGPQRAYLSALFQRYGSQAKFVQIFNEPDQVEFWSGELGEFVRQFRFSRDQVREDLGEIPLVNGGYAFVDRERTRYFIGEIGREVDWAAYHAHGTLEGLKENFALMREQHVEAGIDSPVYVNTETGFDAWRLDQERRQGQAVAQKTLYCWANDHRGVLLFCGRMVKGAGRDGRDLGLLDYQFCPRFGYAAIAGLVSVLAGAEFEATLLEDEEQHLYLFRKGGDKIVAGFTLGQRVEVSLHGTAESFTRYDTMGNVIEKKDARELDWELDGYPRYLLFESGDEIKIRGAAR